MEEKEEKKIEYLKKKEIKMHKLGIKKNNKLNNDNEDTSEEEKMNNDNRNSGYTFNKYFKSEQERISQIDQEKFDSYDINEIDGINRCISKLKSLDIYSSLRINTYEGFVIDKNIIYKNYDSIPIKQLYNESIYLAQYLMYRIINSLKKNNVDLDKKCVTILLDCSVYIMPDKKIMNMFILCAMTMVLNSINIKYSIGLFGEEEFKIIMKQFDDEHSLLILQNVYEGLMMKRYRTNLSSVIKFPEKNENFVGEKNKDNFYKNHPEQIIYIITDGLDEELKCLYSWKKILVRKKNIKYGLIFNEPNKIEELVKNNENKYYKYNRNNESIINNLEYDNDDSISIYDDNFSVLSENSFYSNYSAAYPINKNKKNIDEDKVDENDLKLILQIWKNFIELNLPNLRTTLLSSNEGKLDEKSIKALSIDFSYLICCSGGKNEKANETIEVKYRANEPIKLNNFYFVENIKYKYEGEEKSYVNIKDLNFKSLNRIDDMTSEDYSAINDLKGKVLKSDISIYLKKDFKSFILKEFFNDDSDDIYTRKLIEYIFVPNKASQKVLSTSGTEIDINAFFLHYLSRDPEPLFYLEEKGGYIRKYSVSIIIDISKSVMNEFNKGHSFSIIKTLLKFFRFTNIPNLDIIIATDGNPIILCCGVSSRKVLSKDSEFWIGLIDCLCKPKRKTYLSPCIDISFYLNMERTDYTNYIFILTDGLFDKIENDKILENISKCIQFNIKVFGIGLGFYPYNINSLFPNIIYTKSPKKLFNAISYFFDKNIEVNNEKFSPLLRDISPNYQIIIKKLLNSKDNTISNTKEVLQKKFIINYHLFDNFNEPTDIKDMKNTFDALNDPKLQLIKPDSLRGQKILIVMLWSYELNKEEENPKIMPGYLFESGIPNQPVDYYHPSKNKYCVETAVKSLGGEIFVVMNYADANHELLKTINGKCPYYCVWIISGYDKCRLPDKDADPNLLNEFMNIIHIYATKGGSLVLFGESDPLFFQANLFLEKHKFPTENGEEKTYFRLYGNHNGKKILLADKTGNLDSNQLFNAREEINYPSNLNTIDFNTPAVQRPNLGNNLKMIYEGETISYAQYPELIYPFTKFAVDSEGGVSIAIYMGRNGHGDVIVDGGFTKLFLSMEKEGTFLYLCNLAAFTSRIECNFNKVVKPKTIKYIVQKVEKPINVYNRNILIIDSEINLYNLCQLKSLVKKEYSEGDVIFLANSRKYKVSLKELEDMNKFLPDLSFNNDVIINEINKFEKNLYNNIYVFDIGEQKRNDYKFGDLMLIKHKLKFKYNYTAVHYSLIYKYYNYKLANLKNLNLNIFDLYSFRDNYIELRNYAYGTINTKDENETKELKNILSKINGYLDGEEYYDNYNIDDNRIKYDIINWRVLATKCELELPIAADKNSK